ncbi:dienelactone hydrolase family protein [Rhodococcus sp. SGAir0479]|uniref:dienelactone hydrolase family protein n=1 Tax=Rhodococcus sp. SGAir0479 TaxID=2567884 RepID=UPI0010CD1276|nr:alpha/beta family hydrolase [Rhodococcus sp. SGAir0479]QCQ92288.1 alpha/beta hydrolase [Rhodococcus sp. SGAir0479]
MPTETTFVVDGVRLSGSLTEPAGDLPVVVFAHGSGSGRFSPRNRHVAEFLRTAGLGTLLFDLLAPDEEGDRRLVFDIPLLSERLCVVTAHVRERAPAVAYFGASTGSAAALHAAAEPDAGVTAIVSRGGRPDLAGSRLSAVKAPTLLLVGSLDTTVIDLNRQAETLLECEHDLVIVPGATHLFEEPGTLDVVAEHARNWFLAYGRPGE